MQELQKITQYKMAAEIVLIYTIRQKEFIKDAAENILAFPHQRTIQKKLQKIFGKFTIYAVYRKLY